MSFSVLMAALVLALASPAAASSPGLAEAKQAYAAVDYEAARELCAAALRRGGNDRASTTELYWLWGTAAAAVERSEEAMSAFAHALAADPSLKLDRAISPKLRAPYLEARGKLATADGRPPLEVALRKERRHLQVALRDALNLAGGLEVATRESGAIDFMRRRLPAAPLTELAAPRTSELDFFVRVFDRYDNVLVELGTSRDPHRLAIVRSSPETEPGAAPDAPSRTPYFVVAGTLATLGLAASSVGAVMYVRRENAAREWNSEVCERPGLTREQQCAEVAGRRERAENFALGFGTTGGALLVGSLLSILLTPSPPSSSRSVLRVSANGFLMTWQARL